MTSSKWDRPGSRKGMVSARSKNGLGRAEHLDMLIGFIGFIAFICLIVAIVAEVKGESAFVEVGVLLLFLLPLGALIRLRQKMSQESPAD